MADQLEGALENPPDSQSATTANRAESSQRTTDGDQGAGPPDWMRDLLARYGIANVSSLASGILARAASIDPPSPEEGQISTTRLFIAVIEAGESIASGWAGDGTIIEILYRVCAPSGPLGGRVQNLIKEYLAKAESNRGSVRHVSVTENVSAIVQAAWSNQLTDLGQQRALSADAIAVALLRRGDTRLEEKLRGQGIALSDLRTAALDEVQRSDATRAELWRRAFAGEIQWTRASSELPGFTSDRVETLSADSDPLELLSDVTAFAKLICLEEAEPPLSIGLFGGWGSGKSTFMQLLEREIDRLTKRTRDAAKAPAETLSASPSGPSFIRNVVQVRFNAWHFADANLWASLTAEFFDQLRAGGFARSGKAIHTRLVERVNAHVHTLTSEAATAREALASSEAALRSAQKERDKAVAKAESVPGVAFRQTLVDAVTKSLEQHRSDLKELGKSSPPNDPGKDIEQFVDLAKQLRTAPGQLRALASFVFARGWRATLAVAGIAAVALGLWLMWPTGSSDGAFRLGGIDVLACLAGVAALARAVLPGVRIISGLMDSTASFAASLDGQLEEEIRKVAQAEENLQRAAGETQARRAAAERASKALARYIDPNSNVANPPRLLRFMLEDDPDTRALEKEIGLISRVRRLFQAVDEIVLEEKRKGENAADPDVPDRIVIYIDDLDRCTPAQVYAVLQAIHLLLAFQLFVVVVGVDVGWVQEALAHELRPTLRDALSPTDRTETEIDERKLAIRYLQKIFQLPFWLRPLSTEGSDGGSYGRYIKALLAKNLTAPEGRGPLAATSASDTGPRDSAALESAQLQDDSPQITDDSGLAEALATIRLTPGEVDFLASAAIGKLSGGEPRTVKRFVNIYRLIRARLDGAERDAFLGDGGMLPDYPIVAILIAVETGQMLEIADEFYAGVTDPRAANLDQKNMNSNIAAALQLAKQMRGGAEIAPEERVRWAKIVRRYSFNRYI